MKRAEAVGEARMLGALISEKADAELPDAPQALEFGGVDQANQKFSFGRPGGEADDIVNRIPVYLFDWSTPSFVYFAVLE